MSEIINFLDITGQITIGIVGIGIWLYCVYQTILNLRNWVKNKGKS